MKKYSIAILLMFVSFAAFTQTEVSRDENGSKVLKGFISIQTLETDTAFMWYGNNQRTYVPDSNSIKTLKENKDSLNFIIFGGTWCEDTKVLMPQFFSLLQASGFHHDKLTLLGVDREKKSTQNLSEAFNILNVPTFIIMKKGKEIGRVVEYGKWGSPVKEIADIINKN